MAIVLKTVLFVAVLACVPGQVWSMKMTQEETVEVNNKINVTVNYLRSKIRDLDNTIERINTLMMKEKHRSVKMFECAQNNHIWVEDKEDPMAQGYCDDPLTSGVDGYVEEIEEEKEPEYRWVKVGEPITLVGQERCEDGDDVCFHAYQELNKHPDYDDSCHGYRCNMWETVGEFDFEGAFGKDMKPGGQFYEQSCQCWNKVLVTEE